MAFFFSFFSFEMNILRFQFKIKFGEKNFLGSAVSIRTFSSRKKMKQLLLTNFKSKAMTNFIIKTHRKDTIYTKPHLFILNKGMNSGKPQKEQFTNSFVLIFEKVEDCENIFFVAYSLWQTKFWHPFLIGSVIPFLRLPDFKKEFNPQSSLMMVEHEQHQKNVAALKLLEKKEKQYKEDIHLINDLRKAILYRYCRK
jgi:hypothetical protein